MRLPITLGLFVAGAACFVLVGVVGLGSRGGGVTSVLIALGVALLILALTRRLVYHGRFPR